MDIVRSILVIIGFVYQQQLQNDLISHPDRVSCPSRPLTIVLRMIGL